MSSTTATATSAVSPSATHTTHVGPQPWSTTTTSPIASRMYFVICDQVPVTSTSEVVSPRVKPQDRSIA